MLNAFFQDLKVIELASVLAGPAVGMFFAELGATVLKIENKKTGGDVTRHWKLPTEDPVAENSAYYCSVNYNKEVWMMDLSEEADREKVLQEIANADIVISNFKNDSAAKLGMDYESIKTINPTVIFAHLSGYGLDDNRPAFDVVLQAEAGFLFMCGEPGGNAVKMPVALIDILAAHQLKEGILIGLLRRYKTGEGSYITTSLFESAIASLANQATNYLMAGHIPQKMGTQHPNIAPYGDQFKTQDGKIIILAIGNDRQFEGLCSILGIEDLSTDPRFESNKKRVINRKELADLLRPYVKKENAAFWMEQFAGKKVPAGEVKDMKAVFDDAATRKMVLEDTLEDGRQGKRVKTVAFKIK